MVRTVERRLRHIGQNAQGGAYSSRWMRTMGELFPKKLGVVCLRIAFPGSPVLCRWGKVSRWG